jgi:hypothetical protein
MFPLVAVATAVLPDLIKILAGDKAGTVAGDVAQAVQTVTGSNNPVEARQKLAADPQAAADLQTRLAQIAIDATKAQNDEQDKIRQDQLAQFKEEMQDNLQNTTGARANMIALAKDQSGLGWWPGIVSAAVILGFFIILGVVLFEVQGPSGQKLSDNSVVNITIGALVAAFSTVINFWLGSSLGSHNKDETNAQIQVLRADQDIKSQQSAATGSAPPSSRPSGNAGGGSAAPAGTTAAAAGAKAPAASQAPVQKDNFDACVAITLVEEGGYCVDDGGPTNFGVTHATLAAWRSESDCSPEEVKALTKREAAEIYRAKYWIPAGCPSLPHGVDLAVFDFAVNSGVSRSIKELQKVVGVKDDSSLGPVTLGALHAISPAELINRVCADRLEFLQGLEKEWPLYGKGWAKRIEQIRQEALKMAG